MSEHLNRLQSQAVGKQMNSGLWAAMQGQTQKEAVLFVIHQVPARASVLIALGTKSLAAEWLLEYSWIYLCTLGKVLEVNMIFPSLYRLTLLNIIFQCQYCLWCQFYHLKLPEYKIIIIQPLGFICFIRDENVQKSGSRIQQSLNPS